MDYEGGGLPLTEDLPEVEVLGTESRKVLVFNGCLGNRARLSVGIFGILSGSSYPSLVGVPWTRRRVGYVALSRDTLG
jgi:hypothetical protein